MKRKLTLFLVSWSMIYVPGIAVWALSGDKELLIIPSQSELQVQFDHWVWQYRERDRYRMLGDLVNGQRLIGRTRNQIHALLGQPAPPNNWDNDGTSERSDSYALNTVRCGNAPLHHLDINYENDRVVSFRARCSAFSEPTVYGPIITKNPERLASFHELPRIKRVKVKPANQERHKVAKT